MKSIGKPCVGKAHAWFDEGALRKQVPGTRSSCVRQGVCERARITAESVLYSTLFTTEENKFVLFFTFSVFMGGFGPVREGDGACLEQPAFITPTI
ncbi:MAG: hypothetical protein D3916_06400 [Candidatus Electrothrix sp. MAN1_4]|nr:hypothetical protein [Candidatus Electrothrix sp. MAN1_4]